MLLSYSTCIAVFLRVPPSLPPLPFLALSKLLRQSYRCLAARFRVSVRQTPPADCMREGAGRADLYYETFMTRGHVDSGGLCKAACPLRIVRRGPGGSQVQPSLTIQHLAPNEEVALVFRSRIADPRQDLKITCIASSAYCGVLVCFRKSHENRQPDAIARNSACEHAT